MKLKQKVIKKIKKPATGGTYRVEHVRLESLVSDLNKAQKNLRREIQQQTDELEVKNSQLKRQGKKSKLADEQIHILTKAMEVATDGIFLIDAADPNFSIIYANTALYKITGYTEKDVLWKGYLSNQEAYPELHIIDEIRNALRQGKPFHAEMRNLRKNGEAYWNLLRITPVPSMRGAVAHYIGIKTDVTERRQRDVKIEEQREQLLHVSRVAKLAEFVSSLAHEISQPLTAILAYAQAAQRMLNDREPQVKEIIDYILKDDQRASEVIRRLRALIKKGKSSFDRLDINALIQETIALIKTDVTVRNKIINIELDKDLPVICGDRIQLQQVLLNLISNGLEAMEDMPGASKMLVRTSLKDPGTIKVEVKDSGSGIPEQNIVKLFSHFFTSKSDGLGMGLSISRSICEAHGGHLNGENNSDRGATFYFTLPIASSLPEAYKCSKDVV